MFLDPADDPREGGPCLGDERATLVEFLRCQRLTLELKCADLDAGALARRPVEPSTLSLLGLVRHMAEVERIWFRERLAGQRVRRLFSSEDAPDGEFDGALADGDLVTEAWQAWRDEVDFAESFVRDAENLDVTIDRAGVPQLSLREVLVHMIEE